MSGNTLSAFRVVCAVTNDLNYDQRMQRICQTLQNAGYQTTLIGRALPQSMPPGRRRFGQIRLKCLFHKGPLFYAEYNVRLFFRLLRTPFDAICAVDFDTLPAVTLASILKRKPRVFDAHEYFTETPEVTHRKVVKSVWAMIGRVCLPFYRHAYTVGPALATLFTRQTGIPFAVVRNVPAPALHDPVVLQKKWNNKRIILYQGALNEGRGIESLLSAAHNFPPDVQVILAGEGDLSEKLRQMAADLILSERVVFLGFVRPEELLHWTQRAWLGLNLLENRGLSYYYSLANKYFDYVQAGVPVVTMNFPEYAALQTEYAVAVLLDDLQPATIVQAVENLYDDPNLYAALQANCLQARRVWNWEYDQKTLLNVWERIRQTEPSMTSQV